MFTGIITDIGLVEKIIKQQNSLRIYIKTSYNTQNIAIGASISCNGCCLTVVEKLENLLAFDVSPESISKTILSYAKELDKINLEQAMKLGEELGGHIVTGHVDGIAETVSISELEGNWIVKIKLPLEFSKFLAPKGSITINGVSLTVNDVENNCFKVNIIPHTLIHTNLGNLNVGSLVNFEVDLLARYLERLMPTKNIT